MNSFSDITTLAEAIASDGISSIPHDQIITVSIEAAELGASVVLAQVVADEAQPAVARSRAFGRISAAFLTNDRHLSMVA